MSHCCASSLSLSLSTLYSLSDSLSADTAKASSGSNPLVLCPVCQQTVAGVRFAPHLEK